MLGGGRSVKSQEVGEDLVSSKMMGSRKWTPGGSKSQAGQPCLCAAQSVAILDGWGPTREYRDASKTLKGLEELLQGVDRTK